MAQEDLELRKMLAKQVNHRISILETRSDWTIDMLVPVIYTVAPTEDAAENLVTWIVQTLKEKGGIFTLGLRRTIMEKLRGLLLTTAREWDALSQLALAAADDGRNWGRDYREFSDFFFIRPFLEGPGRFGIVSGPINRSRSEKTGEQALGVGKTDFSVRLIKMFLDAGFCVQTNIHLPREHIPEEYRLYLTEIQSVRQMLMGSIVNYRKHGRLTITILDEIFQYLANERAMSSANVNMKKLVFLLRKLKTSLIAISQDDHDIPSFIAKMAVVNYQKRNHTRMYYHRGGQTVEVDNVPKCELVYNTDHSASFTMADLDIDDMHDYLARMPPEKCTMSVIEEYLNRDAWDPTPQEREACVKVLLTGSAFKAGLIKQKEIADFAGVSPATVYRRKEKLLELGASL